MDSLLDKKGAPHDFTVFRGVNNLGDFKYEPGKIYKKRGYTSTSTDLDKSKNFGASSKSGHLLQIHVPKGHKGLYVGMNGSEGDEKEFILPRNSHIHVLHTEKDENGTTHVHAKLVPPPKSKKQIVESSDTDYAIDASKWKKIGKQLGSNPGGKYADNKGKHWYVKHSHSNDHAKNEVLAGKLYKVAGAPVIEPHLIKLPNGKLGVASKWQNLEGNIDPHNSAHRAEAAKHFATHAWTANWDAAGLDHDNQVLKDGKLHTVDVGGALNYRAMGGPKGNLFGNKVNEWNTLRDQEINEQNHSIFGGMTSKQLHDSAVPVSKVSNDTIHDLVQQHGSGSNTDKHDMISKLIARRDHIAQLGNINKE